MIHAVLIFNKKCQPRLIKFYTPVEISKQRILSKQVHESISQRNNEYQSSFLVSPPAVLTNGTHTEDNSFNEDGEDIQIIYKNYATLYFTFIVDDQESESAILDLIQTFVEALDRCFSEVNELDSIFNWQTSESVLEEIIQGGMVIETSVSKIVQSVDDSNKACESTDGKVGGLLGNSSFGSAFQAFASGGFANWAGSQ